MRPSTELFDLIKSLSKSEKRFFKLTSSLQKGEKNYLKIFNLVETQEDYDEQELKDRFKNEKFIKHLPSEKNHLYKLILKSLRAFHADNSINSILKEEIKNVEILYKKALFKECRKFLIRAKKIASNHEKFYYWFELISWEKLLIEEDYEQGIFTYNLDELIDEELMVIRKLRNLAEYQMLYSKINAIFKSGGFVTTPEEEKQIDEIADYHLIKGKNTAISSSASSMCYYIQGLCSATKRNYEQALEKFNRTKKILNDNPKIKQTTAIRYVRVLMNIIDCYISLGAFKEAEEVTEELKNCTKSKGFQSFDITLKIFTAVYNARITISYKKGDYQSALAIVEEMINGMNTYGDRLPKEQRILFSFHIGNVFFGNGLYKDALKWVNYIVNDNDQNLRQDIYNYTRLFNLIVHYELGNYDLLDYLLKSTQRQINKTSKTKEIELSVLKFIKRVMRTSGSAQRELFQSYLKEFEKLLHDTGSSVINEYFDLKIWLRSKAEDKSIEEIALLEVAEG